MVKIKNKDLIAHQKKSTLKEEIKKQQIIVLITTETNVQDIGWGFIEQVYDLSTKNLN